MRVKTRGAGMLFASDLPVDLVGSQIDFPGPCRGSIIDIDPAEKSNITERLRDSSKLPRIESNASAKPRSRNERKGSSPLPVCPQLHPNTSPPRSQGSGSILAGAALSRQRRQLESNSSLCIMPHSWARLNALCGSCPFRTFSVAISMVASNSPYRTWKCGGAVVEKHSDQDAVECADRGHRRWGLLARSKSESGIRPAF